MHPVLFEAGSFTVYTYGFCIAIGALLGFIYMARQGKKLYGVSFDQSNSLFIYLVFAGVIGGKLFMIFEEPALYLSHPMMLVSGAGFVFYGSLLFAIPVMLWFFRKNKIPTLGMLDVMAAVTCIVHGFGRIGCLMAGCCYGKPTLSSFGIIFTNPACQAEPKNVALIPTQLIEATFIFFLLAGLFWLRSRKRFDGQLFLLYLICYAIGRAILEVFRGDLERGFVFGNHLSNSQLISLLVAGSAFFYYVRLNRQKRLG